MRLAVHSDSEFLSSIEEIVDEVRNGRMIILVDDESRENEGDLIGSDGQPGRRP